MVHQPLHLLWAFAFGAVSLVTLGFFVAHFRQRPANALQRAERWLLPI